MADAKTTERTLFETTERMATGYLFAPTRHTFTTSRHERRCAAPSDREVRVNHDLLAKALEHLPAEQLRVLQLARIDALSHEQIAREMNITPRRVGTLLAKALKRCVEVCQSGGASA